MSIYKNSIILGKHGKPILADVFYTENHQPKPIIIFCHGYKGFKDWGAWNMMAETFADAGFFCVTFNFSHNGGTAEQPIDFPDLEAFGQNNYTKELDDLETVIDWTYNHAEFKKETDHNNLSLIGHSRGGGIVCIKAEEDNRIKKVVTLAGVSDFGIRMGSDTDIALWKKKGVKYVQNGRTKQNMPHYYQFYTDFLKNEKRLTIQRAVSNLKIPYLIIHGDEDTSVSIKEAQALNQWQPHSMLDVIIGANHVFGASHPWEQESLPSALQNVTEKVIAFLKQ
ncbi:alpha/beta hydrolase family protein [Mariniflexile ostreae]|uniref:Alpha/beta hydrolase family protein n=1 Tax=Mariniflexile ostreae TaxID=1520892 RepID=A0ABV5F7W7_9FLAO